MPQQLRKAHQDLDKAVDKLYLANRKVMPSGAGSFTGDRDRVEHLFGLYERLIAPLAAATHKAKRGRSKRAL